MTWTAALARYLPWLRGLGRYPDTVADVRRTLEQFAHFCERLPAEVVEEQVAAFRRHLEWTPTRRGALRSPVTVARQLGHLRVFYRWAYEEGWALVDPTRNLVLKTPPRTLPRLLTVREALDFLRTISPRSVQGKRNRALLEILYGTGLRAGECWRLDLDDLDLLQQTLRVDPGKNGRGRLLPVGPRLARALLRYLKESRPELAKNQAEPALFLSTFGLRLSRMRISQIVRVAAAELGLFKVGPHRLRHACATHLLAGGADLVHVQAILGHASLKSTQIYTHLQPLEVFSEYRRTHPRARRRPPDL